MEAGDHIAVGRENVCTGNKALTINLTERQAWLVTALGDAWIEAEREKLREHNSRICTIYLINGNELSIYTQTEEGTECSVVYRATNLPAPDCIIGEDPVDYDGTLAFNSKEKACDFITEWMTMEDLDDTAVNDLYFMQDIILFHKPKVVSETEWFASALKALENESYTPLFIFTPERFSCRLAEVIDVGIALHRYSITYDSLASFITDSEDSFSYDEAERIIFTSPDKALKFTLDFRHKFTDREFDQAQRRILAWIKSSM